METPKWLCIGVLATGHRSTGNPRPMGRSAAGQLLLTAARISGDRARKRRGDRPPGHPRRRAACVGRRVVRGAGRRRAARPCRRGPGGGAAAVPPPTAPGPHASSFGPSFEGRFMELPQFRWGSSRPDCYRASGGSRPRGTSVQPLALRLIMVSSCGSPRSGAAGTGVVRGGRSPRPRAGSRADGCERAWAAAAGRRPPRLLRPRRAPGRARRPRGSCPRSSPS